jgi:peptidyl-prolyl cis-trans isomerase SurA
MNKLKSLILLALFLSPSLPGFAEVVDRVVAVVGNEVITMSDVKKFNASRSANPKLLAAGTPGTAAHDPLDLLIREKILKLEMERLGVTVTEADIDMGVKDVLTRNSITMDMLKAELSRKGMSYDQYRKDLGEQMKQMRFLSQVIFPRIKLSEDDIARKAGPNPTEASRTQARIELLQARSSEELAKYLDESRSNTFVEIKTQ